MSDNFLSINGETVWGILMRFGINLFFLFMLIRVIYFRYSKKEKFLFTFFLMGIIIFMICSMLRSVELQLGMALGLFAIFAILRFRTRNFSVKDISARTGQDIIRIKIRNIDFKKEITVLDIFFKE